MVSVNLRIFGISGSSGDEMVGVLYTMERIEEAKAVYISATVSNGP